MRPFPREEPGQRVRFGFQVIGWTLQSAWLAFKRLPRWVRVLVYAWLLIVVVSRGCTPSHDRHASHLAAAQEQKLAEIGASHPGAWTAADAAQLIAQVAKELPAEAADASSGYAPVLAIPFAAPVSAGGAAQKLAGSVFAQLYGRLAIAHHGRVALGDSPLPDLDATAALQQGRAHHSSYIVYGAITGSAPDLQLTVKVIAAQEGSPVWSESYPVAEADAADIAAKVSARVPRKTQE